MKILRWNQKKANQLVLDETRGKIGFEQSVIALETGGLSDDVPNPNFRHQRLFSLGGCADLAVIALNKNGEIINEKPAGEGTAGFSVDRSMEGR